MYVKNSRKIDIGKGGGGDHKRLVIHGFSDFSGVSLNGLLNKQLSCWWFGTQRGSCDVYIAQVNSQETNLLEQFC